MDSNLVTPHAHIRGVLSALRTLHEEGYEALRLMLLSTGEGHTIFVGPRKLFSASDGMYIPADLRHRAVPVVSSGAAPTSGDLLAEARSRLSAGMSSAIVDVDGKDPDYVAWLSRLSAFLAIYPLAWPRRTQEDYVRGPSLLRIEFRRSLSDRPLAPHHMFAAVPPGTLIAASEDGANPHPERIAAARPADAPNLLWPASRIATDEIADQRFEDRLRATDRD